MDSINFEWDENKNQINKKKHGIDFEEAKTVFYQMCRKTPCFSYGDIRHVHRIYAGN